jgi:hypothetical protein
MGGHEEGAAGGAGADPAAGQSAADKSSRDHRKISTLGVLSLLMGAGLLVCSVFFVTIPSIANPVMSDIGPFTFRLLFCVSLGLILVGLGDYAFYTINSSFVVGGATAIALGIFGILQLAKPGELPNVVARVVVKGSLPADAAVTLVAADSTSIRAEKDAAPGIDSIFLLDLKRDLARQLLQQCFRIVYSGVPDFYVSGPEARLPANFDLLFHFIIDRQKLYRLRADGLNDAVPACDPNRLATRDAPPAINATIIGSAISTSISSGNSSSGNTGTEPLGWTYFGNEYTPPSNWGERVYDNQTQARAAPPKSGDKIVALTDVYLRKGPIDCDNGNCTLAPVVRPVRSGETFVVTSVKKVIASYWAEISKQ